MIFRFQNFYGFPNLESDCYKNGVPQEFELISTLSGAMPKFFFRIVIPSGFSNLLYCSCSKK